jgi:NDP-sugar pyrophosphorylase family protein
MKAVILAGGEGTRLRPLTLTLPKPVVPVVDRPFLRHQLDLLDRIGVKEVVFSVAYRPEKIEAVFGDGTAVGKRIHYAVEETPLGTGGAVKNAEARLDGTTVVFNGDVLTDVDLPAVLDRHRSTGAAATIVLYPVPNPSAYGLVETDADSRVKRFVEKPEPSQITTDTINAGIYVLEKPTLALMPTGVTHSIERAFFPALLERGDHVQAFVHRGYWIDIGTPTKYLDVHRDILNGRFPVALMAEPVAGGWIHAGATVDPGADLRPPFFVGPDCRVEAGCVLGPDAVFTESVSLGSGSEVSDSVLWQGVEVGHGARIQGSLLSAGVKIGDKAVVGPGSVLGEGTCVTAYSRTGAP